MNKLVRILIVFSIGVFFLFFTTAYLVSDPQADYKSESVQVGDMIKLSQIKTKNTQFCSFKSSVKLIQSTEVSPDKEFYGQEIRIQDNPKIDRILIGVTSNLISRVEIWSNNNLISVKEKGFVGKITKGKAQTLSVDFYDQRTKKYKGESKLSMRYYSGSGFLGDIGTISFDLSDFGDMSGEKSIGLFAKSLESQKEIATEFKSHQVWKHYNSFD